MNTIKELTTATQPNATSQALANGQKRPDLPPAFVVGEINALQLLKQIGPLPVSWTLVKENPAPVETKTEGPDDKEKAGNQPSDILPPPRLPHWLTKWDDKSEPQDGTNGAEAEAVAELPAATVDENISPKPLDIKIKETSSTPPHDEAAPVQTHRRKKGPNYFKADRLTFEIKSNVFPDESDLTITYLYKYLKDLVENKNRSVQIKITPETIEKITIVTQKAKEYINAAAQEAHNANDEITRELGKSGKAVINGTFVKQYLERFVRATPEHAYAKGLIEGGHITVTAT